MDDVYCVNGCGRPAIGERPYSVGVDEDGGLEEVVELVCAECAQE